MCCNDYLYSFSITYFFFISVFLFYWLEIVLFSHFTFVCFLCLFSHLPHSIIFRTCVCASFMCLHLYLILGKVNVFLFVSLYLSGPLCLFLLLTLGNFLFFFSPCFCLFPGSFYPTFLCICHRHPQRTNQITNY